MKKFSSSAAAIFLSLALSTQAQTNNESLGLPGDNFDLYGALDLFKDSRNAESFERSLNSQDSKINNLDLNADGRVDYVKVVDRGTGDTKILILQDVIGENESQDIAVIEMDKRGDGIANLQIVGDEALYGKDYIIVPEEETQNTVYTNKVRRTNVYINVWTWPGVSWVYAPTYTVWVSPFYWTAYPTWWSPWSPLGWDVYYPRVYAYHHPYYFRAYNHCLPHVHRQYYGHRTSSVTVINRNKAVYHSEIPDRKYESHGRGRVDNQGRPNRDVRDGHNEVQPNRGEARPQKGTGQPRRNDSAQPRKNDSAQPRGKGTAQPRGKGTAQPRGKSPNQYDDSRGNTNHQNQAATRGNNQSKSSSGQHAGPRNGGAHQNQPAHQNRGNSGGVGRGAQGGHSGGNSDGAKRGR